MDLDFEAMRVSLKSSHGAIILFDFKAAFPSLAHSFLWRALSSLGLPPPLVNALEMFYVNNTHRIKVKGQTFPSVCTRCGIRQGCPLSPMLFAVVVDVLLRRLVELMPNCVFRAFADDVGMVTSNFGQVADTLQREFDEFGAISNMQLNMNKTVLIPLWHCELHAAQAYVRETFPFWFQSQISRSGRYLGVEIGPGKNCKSWGAAVRKYEERALVWSQCRQGLFRNVSNYKIFVVSVLSFVMQLENVPADFSRLENRVLHLFTPGPGNWIHKKDLFNLQKLFSFPNSFASVLTLAVASKLRVSKYEVPRSREMAFELDELLTGATVLPFAADWYANSHCKVLVQAAHAAEQFGVSQVSIINALSSRGAAHAAHADLDAFIKNNFQREAYQQLMSKAWDRCVAEHRHRQKQTRWDLNTWPRLAAYRAISLFKRIGRLVKPSVHASLIRTHWNAWCTRRRFQQEGPCMFGCSATALDALEHYVHCRWFRELTENILHLPRVNNMSEFLLLDHRLWSDRRLTVMAIAIHVLYTVFNRLRLHPSARTIEHLHELLRRTCYHAVLGHRGSANTLQMAMNNSLHWWH